MLADGIAQAAHDGGQGAEAVRQRGPGSILDVQHQARRAARIPGGRRMQADAARSPQRDWRGQRGLGYYAIEAQIAGHGGLFRRGDFQQDAARLGARQAQQFLGALAPGGRNDDAFGLGGKLRTDGIQPDAEQCGPMLPETVRRVQNKKLKL